MKASSIKRLTVALFILLALIFGGQVLRFSRYVLIDDKWYDYYGGDACLRRDEILCAHQGVNSFHIWNGDTKLAGFVPYHRPDITNVVATSNDRAVHAYPPWHTAVSYWFGWVSERTYLVVMTVFFWLCLWFVVLESIRITKARFKDYWLIAGLALAMIAQGVEICFTSLNYGVLALAAFLLMNKALERNQNVLAGLAWAVMMIKPQVGLLFGWPLFWKRHYLTIVTAAVICLAETVVTSFLVHESVINLILQVPQIGGPYPKGLIAGCLKPILGSAAPIVVMATFFILTGLATWGLRKNNDFIICCLPVALASSVWTYCGIYDRIILLPVYIVLIGKFLEMQKPWWNGWKMIGGFYVMMAIFIAVWTLKMSVDPFAPSVQASHALRIARDTSWGLSLVVFIVLFFRKEFRPK